MKANRNITKEILIVFIIAFSIGTLVNIYYSFQPSSYHPAKFNASSLMDWSIIITEGFIILMFYLVARHCKNKYAKKFWFFQVALMAFNILRHRVFVESSNFISATENGISFVISIIFLFLYKKNKFDLLEGFSFRIKNHTT